ncbi:MAG: glycoside hydrolase family 13 protein [Clostridia bacterium]|nr:glycoside hydrolase family 13 protein [Clostridia bacterium]
MEFIPFNSRYTYHKSPFGAVPAGQTVTFRIVLPRAFGCTGASLIVSAESGHTEMAAMRWERMEGTAEEWWTVQFTPRTPGLYWYHFALAQRDGGSLITRFACGIGEISGAGTSFQLTVYDPAFQTPDWFKGGVLYQIFPDRFCASGTPKTGVPAGRVLRRDWGGQPLWEPDEDGKIHRYDFFGGDLRGIAEKLPYLQSLGVTAIYLNPIFEAESNHRYDTGDYEKIDPLLGDAADFEALCAAAEKAGIGILLDGVFSHTGANSKYFNKDGRYPTVGAYQGKDSPYFDWYRFIEYPEEYDCWWGVDILPEIDEENEDYIAYMAGENGILRRWLRAGARGWRLDVADELPDRFLDALRTAVKTEKPDALIIGEVWEDASNKISYGQRRRYLGGAQLDTVMNYPFAARLIEFAVTGVAEGFHDAIQEICENYPKPAVDCLMNHIGTHDTCRILNRLATHGSYVSTERERYAGGLDAAERAEGVQLLKMTAAVQFTLPGVPSIYYGDEAGLDGGEDPFNRGCYPWGREDPALLAWYRALGALRRAHPVYIDGDYVPVSDALGCIAFERRGRGERLLTVANRNEHAIVYWLPDYGFTALLGGEVRGRELYLEAKSAAVLAFQAPQEQQ